MAAGRQPVARSTHSVGLTVKVVQVTAITPDSKTAIATDSLGTEVRIPLLVQRAKAALPAVGETWLVSQETGIWTFHSFVGSSPADFSTGDGGTGPPGSLITFSGTAPASPTAGQVWFNTAGGTISQWTGSTWKQFKLSGIQGLLFGSVTADQIAADAGITAGQVDFSVNDIGGVKVTFSAIAPSGPSVGDVWINPNAGNVLANWSGSAWVLYKFDSSALAANAAILGSQLASNAAILGSQLSATAGITAGQVNFTAHEIGGTSVTVASTAPSSPVSGDLWFDGGNGYRLNQWSGSAWLPFQFGTSSIAAGSITAALIAAGTITASQIAAGSITADRIAAGSITATQISAGSITGDRLAANTITASQIAANTITAAQVAASTITAAQILAGSITGDRLQANTITAAAIAAGTITAAEISAGTITSDLIATNAIVAGQIAAGAIDGTVINAITINTGTFSASDFIVSAADGGLFVYGSGGTTVKTITGPGSGTWKAPPGVTTVKAECWGGGAGGASASGGNGGGGAEYAAEAALTVVPGTSYNYSIGSGGAATISGGNTTFTVGATTVTAHGGKNIGTAGSGSTNTTHFNGGAGANGGVISGQSYSGGGGSSAGPGGHGGNGFQSNGGIPPSGGGAGGNGATLGVNGPGGAGGSPGGGGGGGTAGGAPGGSGQAGWVRLTYASTSTNLTGSIAGAATTDPLIGGAIAEGAFFDNLQVTNGITLSSTDGNWHTASLSNGSGLARYRKVASPPNCVMIQLHVNFSPVVSGTVGLFTMASGFAPANEFRGPVGVFTNTNTVSGIANTRLDVTTGGLVQLLGAPSSTSEASGVVIVPID